MSVTRLLGIAGLVCTVFTHTALAGGQSNGAFEQYTLETEFEYAVEDLINAITNKGLVVDHVSHVGNMLNRTEKDVGATRTVFKHAQVLQFCSTTLSRAAVEADPINLAYCPYSVFAFETTKNPGKVTIGYRLLTGGINAASKKALADANKLLSEVLLEAR